MKVLKEAISGISLIFIVLISFVFTFLMYATYISTKDPKKHNPVNIFTIHTPKNVYYLDVKLNRITIEGRDTIFMFNDPLLMADYLEGLTKRESNKK